MNKLYLKKLSFFFLLTMTSLVSAMDNKTARYLAGYKGEFGESDIVLKTCVRKNKKRNNNEYHFSKHANDRLVEREISKADVLKTIESGIKRTVSKNVYLAIEPSIQVSVIFDEGTKTIITVYSPDDMGLVYKKFKETYGFKNYTEFKKIFGLE